MTAMLKQPESLPRDGTSQKARTLAALDPDSVPVDERTLPDLVVFARELGKSLVYYDADKQPTGDWSGFIGGLDPGLVAAFLDNPARFDPATTPELFRPHFVLFLAFLQLFERARAALNSVTRRHLDFYYRRVLQMAGKGPVADHVHLVLDLARGEREVLVRKDSLVSAGPDRLGRDQVYATEQPIIVNRIAIARTRTIHVARQRTGFVAARADHPRAPLDAFLEMLGIALGEPLPAFQGSTGPLTVKQLVQLAARADGDDEVTPRPGTVPGQPDPDRFYLTVSEIGDVVRVNALLAADHPEKPSKLAELLDRSRRRQRALGIQHPVVPKVEDIVAYWEALGSYFRMPPESFHQIMQLLLHPEADPWSQVDTLLEAAHQRKVREDRIGRLREIHAAQPDAGLLPLVREVLGDDAASPADLTSFLDMTALDSLTHAEAAGDWETLYSVLELAQRHRTGERPAQKVTWLDILAADDAPTTATRPAPDGPGSAGRWATFGLPRAANPSTPPAPIIGWAIASPLLWLREGTRTITLILELGRDASAQKTALHDVLTAKPCPLMFQVSTARTWVECSSATIEVDSLATLLNQTPTAGDPLAIRCTMTVGGNVDPIAPLADLGAPAVRVMLRPIQLAAGAPYTTRYTELSALPLVGVRVQVDASELCPQRLQNDERMLDPAKPFTPFGAAPAIGSRLRIGHSELSGKRLDELRLDLEWMGLPPEGLTTHYGAYQRQDGSRLVNVNEIAVDLSLIDRGQPTTLVEAAALFGSKPSISVSSTSPAGTLDPEALSAAALPDELASWRRYLQCELVGSDLGHAVYPALAASKAVDLATDVANQKEKLDAADYKVNPPYTPRLKRLSLRYSASQAIRLDAGPPDAGVARILYVHPFGQCDVHRELGATPPAAGVPFLPRYDNDGELYLGLTDVAPPQSVSLLFQLAEGSADPELPAQPVVWSYLDGDFWRPFAHRVLRDTTGGLTSAGIVELALDPVAPSARFGDGLYWIRAAVEQNTASVCDTIDIHPQAVSAVFVDHDNAPDHFRTPLSPGSIKKLSSRIAGIAGVRQPYTSRGGRAAEDPSMFATRVSERLRHKQRALSMWDYERLILEQFPQVYKARCLPAPATAPGKVEIIVIPDIHNLLPSDPFEPKAPSSLLGEIANYLRGRMPAFADVVVRNPRYVSVRVRLSVRFRNAGNDAFYIRTLNDDLNRFLSPWAFDDGSDIVLGGRIYANSIVDFVDRRDYVDYVAGVQLFWRTADGDYQVIPPDQGDEGYFATAASPDAVLVAARTHEITVLTEAAFDETSLFGINFMKVELDFFVG